MNIGVHFFDILIYLFGEAQASEVHLMQPERAAGVIDLATARVRWFLSVDSSDLPDECRRTGQTALRSIQIDGEEIDFTGGFEDLHTRVYEESIAGRGFGIEEARPGIELVHSIRISEVNPSAASNAVHPYLAR